jgi:hypothetical protein
VGGPLLGVGGDPAPGLAALDRYRDEYRPSVDHPEPAVAVSLDVLVADTAARARDLLLPEAWAMAQARTTGSFPALEPVETIRAHELVASSSTYDRTALAESDAALAELFARQPSDVSAAARPAPSPA